MVSLRRDGFEIAIMAPLLLEDYLAMASAIALLVLVTSEALMVRAGWIVCTVLSVFGYLAGLVMVHKSG